MMTSAIIFDRLLKLYQDGRISDTGLAEAVTKGYITEEQKATILATRV